MSPGATAESAPNASTAQARVLIDELARCGVTDAVLCPGSRSAPFAFALDAEPRIRLHVHPDERSAAFVALGLGLATGRPALVIVTSGTAVANLHPAVLEADAAGVPLLLLTADRPPELRETGADQTVRQVGIFGDVVRWSFDLGVAEDRADAVTSWRAIASRAHAAALGLATPPGPVQLNVPFREPTVPLADDGRTVGAPFTTALDGRARAKAWVEQVSGRMVLDERSIEELAARFVATERGVILVGSGAQDAATAEAAHLLARVTGWPVLAEGHTAARHRPGALRAWPHLVEQAGFIATHRPDLAVRMGRVSLTPAVAGLLAGSTHEILIDRFGRWLDPRRSMGELVIADPVDTLTRVASVIGVDTGSAWADEWRTADAVAEVAVQAFLADSGAMPAVRAVQDALLALPPAARVVVGSSLAIRHVERHVPPREAAQWFANRGAAGIDGTVATAFGIALAADADPGDRRAEEPVTLAILGDLTALHDANAWLVAPDAPQPTLIVLVLDDGGGTIFDLLPPSRFPAQRRLFATPHGRDLARLAHLHDVHYGNIDVTGVAASVSAAMARGGACILRVAVPPPSVEAARLLRQQVAEALRAQGIAGGQRGD